MKLPGRELTNTWHRELLRVAIRPLRICITVILDCSALVVGVHLDWTYISVSLGWVAVYLNYNMSEEELKHGN